MSCDLESVGIVIIGRNEGKRLERSLSSAIGKTPYLVYVDSGSADGSSEWVRSQGVETVELDSSAPFTAARARNAGFCRLLEIVPNLEFVQFIDGDCELAENWLTLALEASQSSARIGVVCGRRREKFPHASLYNLLCDLEWDTPAGEVKESTGDALMRVSAFQSVNGYNPTLIAGEDPELCLRLRRQRWKILRLSAEMVRHDAEITRFGQWWKRSQRAGYSYAEGAWMYARSPERHYVRESQRIWLWGLWLPVISLLGIFWTGGWSLLLLLGYLALSLKTFLHYRTFSWDFRESFLYSSFCVLAKFPQVQGQIQFHRKRLLGLAPSLIEYKMQAESRSTITLLH